MANTLAWMGRLVAMIRVGDIGVRWLPRRLGRGDEIMRVLDSKQLLLIRNAGGGWMVMRDQKDGGGRIELLQIHSKYTS
jgi:hypothetical protein